MFVLCHARLCTLWMPLNRSLHVLLLFQLVEHVHVTYASAGALAGQQCCWFAVRSERHRVQHMRADTGSVKYIWPLQTALSDFGAQRKRLDAIRSELGWPIIGCKYVECYS